MKIKPQIYAQTLVEATDGNNAKAVASRFWRLLQKNKQYKDLNKIVELLDEESAKKQGKILVKVYSEKELGGTEIREIESKLSKKFHNSLFIIHNSIKNGVTGIIVKVSDQIIDLSVEGKISKLKKRLTT